MYILKNAMRNIVRNKGRNILLGIILFVMILGTAISVIIGAATSAIIEDYKQRFGCKVMITPDFKNGPISDYKPLTEQELYDYGKSDYLLGFSLENKYGAIPVGLSSFDEENDNDGPGATYDIDGKNYTVTDPKATVIGSTRKDISEEFATGQRKIVDGKMYEAQNECLISEPYATRNHLAVGDQIEIRDYIEENTERDIFTVVGIFSDTTMDGKAKTPYDFSAVNRYNDILVSYETLLDMKIRAANPFEQQWGGQLAVEYILKDPSMLKAFEKEVKEKGLREYFKVSIDTARYHKIVGPMEGLQKVVDSFVIVVLALGSAVLAVLSLIVVRERKYEVGVLRAIGMKKLKVALGFLCESLLLTAICLCLGLGIGKLAAQPIANGMLQNQITLAEETPSADNDPSGAVSMDTLRDNTKPLSEIAVTLTGDMIGQIAGISLVLAGISSLAGIVFIMKYEPRKILSERN